MGRHQVSLEGGTVIFWENVSLSIPSETKPNKAFTKVCWL